MKIFFKKGKIGKPAFSASTKNAMSQIKSRVAAPVTALTGPSPSRTPALVAMYGIW